MWTWMTNTSAISMRPALAACTSSPQPGFTTTIVVSAEANAAYPEGTKLLARQEMRVNRKDADVNTIRVYLVDDDGKQQP